MNLYNLKRKTKMKNIVLFILLCGLYHSCTTDESLLMPEKERVSTDKAEAPEYVTVSLSMGGEITSEDQPLLTKAETDSRDLYGVQVFKGNGYFAYGLFYNVDSMKITLLSGSTYRFVCTLVKNGRDLLYFSSVKQKPFYIESSYNKYNHFVYNINSYLNIDHLRSGTSTLVNGNTVSYPQADRFYGELSNYTPAANGTVALDMKRTAFGIKFKVIDIPDGTVTVTCRNSTQSLITTPGLGANAETAGVIFTFNNVYAAWQYASTYTENVKVSVSHTRGNGIVEYKGTKEITVKRNAMNIIRITLGATDGDVSFGITTENEAMGQENVTIPLR
jgi:hypothetical protein